MSCWLEDAMARFHQIFCLLLTSSTAYPTFAGQCYAPSDPIRLTRLEQRAVVLTISDDPEVFSADFSLKRTLHNILATTPGANPSAIGDAEIEALLQTMLDDLAAPELANAEARITYTVQPRPGEARLAAKALLTPGGADEMKPVGLFNRLDLTPGDFSNCGEFRIVYAKNSHLGGSPTETRPQFDDRLTIIFEAALTNPDPTGDPGQCQQAWGLWKTFSQAAADGSPKVSDAEIGQQLSAFYYDGGPIGASGTFEPVVDYRHYGLPNGQVRANAFVQPADTHPGGGPALNWHLRQWRVFFDDNSSNSPAIFEPRALNENPVPGFFDGSNPGVKTGDEGKFDVLAGLFRNTFVHTNVPQLTAVDALAAIPSSTPSTVADLIDNVGVDIDDRFYAVDSDAGPPQGPAADDPAGRVSVGSPVSNALFDRLARLKIGEACGLTPTHVLNRMGAMTCAGCHQFSNGKEIAPGIRWPLSSTFVHINEAGGLSALLLDRFLPFRYHLMDGITPTAPTLSQVLSSNAGALAVSDLAAKRQDLDSKLSQLTSSKSVEALVTVSNLSAEIRQFDKSQVGAFVMFRKPD
jgi:hypothetical protein